MSKKMELNTADNKDENMVKDELKSNSKIDTDNYDTPAIIKDCEQITNIKETATKMQSNEEHSNDNDYSCDLKGTSKADINTPNIKQQAKVVSTKKRVKAHEEKKNSLTGPKHVDALQIHKSVNRSMKSNSR